MPAEEDDLQALANIAEASTAAAVPELLRAYWDAQWIQAAAITDPDQRLEALASLSLQCPGLSLRMDSLLRKEWKSIPPHLWKRLNERLGQGGQP